MILILLATEFYFIYSSFRENFNQFVYPLDDAYIHMSIAKNYVVHGVWGTHPDYFTSSTSSPLYTLLISVIFKLVGVNIYVPLVLNILFGCLLMAFSYFILIKYKVSHLPAFLVCLGIFFIAPIPSLIFSGMEHILHILITLIYLYLFFDFLDKKSTLKRIFFLGLIGFLLCSIRYEGVFLVFISACFLIYKKQFRDSIILLIFAALPIIIYGIISLKNGWYFLPNSLLLKGNMISFSLKGLKKLFKIFQTLYLDPRLINILLINLFIFIYSYRKNLKEWMAISFVLFAISLFHFEFAAIGWFYRYETYIVYSVFLFGSIFLIKYIIPALKEVQQRTLKYVVVYSCCVLLAFPFLLRGISSFTESPKASSDRYMEHILTTNFLNRYYSNSVVAVNDIGTISFFTSVKYYDIFGLGDKEPMAYRKYKQGFTREDLYKWMKDKNVQIAFLQTEWNEIKDRIPQEWVLAAKWKTPQNVIFGDLESSFYAVNPEQKDQLIENLKEYSKDIPGDIQIIYNE
ncbi:MAG: hypothetical protein WDN26_21610 [Chitinophagaceae bacterium]